jgi:murein DD-endopeptidase
LTYFFDPGIFMPASPQLRVSELFGLRPIGPTLQQAKLVFLGDPELPKSRFGRSSLELATPRMSMATWRGKRVAGRMIPLLNLFNRTPTPPSEGWSVRVTQVEDFRGRKLTYDSHNGTDFVIPPGTEVAVSAAGRVVAQRQEWNRGGLKIYVDHGAGLCTSYHHLGRSLVQVGERVKAGQVIALSAYSGADGFLTFPWVAPHVHYNTYVDGILVDPFAAPGETSLWVHANDPRPVSGKADSDFSPTVFSRDQVDRLLNDLNDSRRRRFFDALFLQLEDPTLRAFELLVEANTYPTRFDTPHAGSLLYSKTHPRAGRLSLPFRGEDFDGTAFCDNLGLR